MARPKKLNAEYFSHDCDMRNDIRIRNIRRRFGHEGYSLWNMILEHLGDCDYFEYKWTDENIELLEPDFDMDADRIKEIVNHMIHLDILQIMNGYLTCDKFTERLVDTLSKKRDSFDLHKSHRYTIERNKLNGNSINLQENPQSKVKESKVKNTTLYESIVEYSIEKQKEENSDTDTNETPLGGGVSSTEELKSLVLNGLNK